jgi:nicotinate-nucleotide pyrophosphorylase (carboxylating)
MDKNTLELIEKTLEEDHYLNDITSNYLIDSSKIAGGNFIARSTGVVSGLEVVETIFKLINKKIEFGILRPDGSFVNRGDVIAFVRGPVRDILRGERVALNFLQRLSGVASLVSKYVQELKGTNCKLIDTRDTMPLFRNLERNAFVHGGGENGQAHLEDCIVIKDNHLSEIDSIQNAVSFCKKNLSKNTKIQVEVETKEEFIDALSSKCDVIILDSMNNELMKELVTLNNGEKILIAKGNINYQKARAVALTGVNYIMVSSLNQSYKSLDIVLKFYKKFHFKLTK